MFTKYLLPLVLAAACGSCRTGATVELQPILFQHQLAMRQLATTYALGASNRAGVLSNVEIGACFNYYNTAQESVATKYNTAYLGCVSATAAAKKALSAQSAQQRADLVTRGTDVCSQLQSCEKDEDSLDFFKCNYNVTDTTLSDWYGISVQAESIVSNLKVQYQKIDDDENICTTTAKNEYVSSLSMVASNLNKCLIGTFVPPTSVVTTEAPATGEPTTEEPSTEEPTTEVPVTDEPSTEASPTDEPTTEASSTDEPTTEASPTDEPSTEASPTDEPSTEASPTEEPSTEASSTDEPSTNTDESTVTDEPTPETTTISPDLQPEEDVMRYRPMTRMNMWNMMRRL